MDCPSLDIFKSRLNTSLSLLSAGNVALDGLQWSLPTSAILGLTNIPSLVIQWPFHPIFKLITRIIFTSKSKNYNRAALTVLSKRLHNQLHAAKPIQIQNSSKTEAQVVKETRHHEEKMLTLASHGCLIEMLTCTGKSSHGGGV